MILAGDMQPNFVAVGGGCFNKFWDLWPRAAASAADSAAKVTGQISDPTFATNHVAVELARVGRERPEYNSLIVVRSAIHRPIILWSHIFHENSEGKNNPSATPPTSLETVSIL
jgi:hypothetical protein